MHLLQTLLTANKKATRGSFFGVASVLLDFYGKAVKLAVKAQKANCQELIANCYTPACAFLQ